MRVILSGYGKMGHEIEKIAIARGHSIVAVYNLELDWLTNPIPECDIAIDFSTPETAPVIINKLFDLDIPVVSGTTGWNDKLKSAKERALSEGKTFFYASNFSIGVNIFFEINKRLASFLCPLDNYKASISETHHIHKKDSPSGTAITLAEGIMEVCDKYKSWDLVNDEDKNKTWDIEKDEYKYKSWDLDKDEQDSIKIASTRIGEIPGTHVVQWDSDIESLQLIHTSHNRQGLAFGAIIAAEWVVNKKGFFGMSTLLKDRV